MNHRIGGWEVQPHCSGPGQLELKTLQCLWAICFCVMTTITIKRVFICLNEFPVFQLMPIALCPFSNWENSGEVFTSQIRYTLVRSLWSLLFSKLKSLSQPFFIWQMLQSCSCPCDGLSPVCLCLLYWGAQHWTEHSRCFLRVLSRGAVSSPSTCSQCYAIFNTILSLL